MSTRHRLLIGAGLILGLALACLAFGLAIIGGGSGACWWLSRGVRRAQRVHDRWRVAHGWRVAHFVARPGGDRRLDFLLAALLVPLGPLVPRCNRQIVFVGLHLLALLIFGTVPQVSRPPITPPSLGPVPAFLSSPNPPASGPQLRDV